MSNEKKSNCVLNRYRILSKKLIIQSQWLLKFNKLIILPLLLLFGVANACNGDESRNISIQCEEIEWADVQQMVQPYLSDIEYTALVMQGQSSEYNAAVAAGHVLAYEAELPRIVRSVLSSIVEADC